MAHRSQPGNRWEVLRIQFGRETRVSVHLERDRAEMEAQALAVLLTAAVTA